MTTRERTARGLDLQAGEETLARHLGQLRSRLEGHRSAFFHRLDEVLTARMQAAFEKAYEAHLLLAREAELTEEATPATPLLDGPNPQPQGVEANGSGTAGGSPRPRNSGAERGRRLRRYREGLREEVLDPLREALGELEIGRTLGERWSGFLDGMPALVENLPESILRPEPDDLYAPKASDGRFKRLRKALVRGRRGAGKVLSAPFRIFRRTQDGDLDRVQTVPVRRLARQCLLGRCPMALESCADALQQHYAAPIAGLEAAVTVWSEGWFAAEEAVQETEGSLGVRFLEEIALAGPSVPEEDPEGGRPDPGEDSASTEGPGADREVFAEEGTESSDEGGSPFRAPDPETLCLTLSAALAEGASLTSPDSVQEEVSRAMESEWTDFLERVRVSDSFQEASGKGESVSRVDAVTGWQAAGAQRWQEWHRNALGRVYLCVLILRLREDFDEAESHLLGAVVDQALSSIGASLKRSWEGLKHLSAMAEDAFSGAPDSRDSASVLQTVEDLLEKAENLLGEHLQNLADTTESGALIQSAADGVAANLSEALRFLPDTVSLSSLQSSEGGPVTPTSSTRTVPFRESAQRAVDVLRIEAIRTSPGPLLEFLESTAVECQELPNVVQYNLTAAKEELESPSEASLEASIEAARSLTLDGLDRTASGVRNLLESLGSAWTDFARTAHDLLESGFSEIHTRAVAEGAVQEQMLGVQALARAWGRSGLGRTRAWLERVEKVLTRLLRMGWVRGARLIRMGRMAVGHAEDPEGEAERAMGILRGVPALLDSLPLVYRRLFSFRPVSDPKLLIGREDELQWVERRIESWRSGFTTPCVFTGPLGVGHTSFLNILASTTLEGLRIHRVILDRRIRTEEDLASFLASALDLGSSDPWTLDGVAQRLMGPETRAIRDRVVLVEHLEHLLLRTPGGTNLLERFLTLQVETGGRILWMSNTSGATWKIMEKSEPSAVSMVAQYPISAPSREEMEELIMARHRRSGLPVEFVHHGDLNPLLRRRLRLARGDKAKQGILRGEFFDRVHRMSEGSIPMAILLWLRSADFSSKEGSLRVHAPRPIRFAFLDDLDLELSFALKAFMEHGSLTLEEYGEIFGTSPQEAYQAFEALRSRAILEPLTDAAGPFQSPDRVEAGERYRVPRILSQVVANRLKNRNILH